MKLRLDTHKNAEVVLNKVWILNKTTEITNQKDLKISSSVETNLKNYLQQIEIATSDTHTFQNPTLTIEDFAKAIHIQIVHILYIFKYHCTVTFVEYKKMIRIQHAIHLLENHF